ncbi:hypothetical protein SDC9_102569 [bioreactor metagenome]|uniref:Uncharacterized protein n=1 Tax=bioreactor metagenome TaxID=1076179 RepID=A0A645AR83_9ZZZZ
MIGYSVIAVYINGKSPNSVIAVNTGFDHSEAVPLSIYMPFLINKITRIV